MGIKYSVQQRMVDVKTYTGKNHKKVPKQMCCMSIVLQLVLLSSVYWCSHPLLISLYTVDYLNIW